MSIQYNLNLISNLDSIGDSLVTMNTNYTTIQTWVDDIQTNFDSTWNPVISFYKENLNNLQIALSLVQANSANWSSFITTVQTNSAKWLRPFSAFYPSLLPNSDLNANLQVINSWVKTNFPVINSDGSLNYVEGQKIIVNYYSQGIIDDHTINDINIISLDSTPCRTHNKTICAQCTTTVEPGFVGCHQGTFSCADSFGSSQCATSHCYYCDPYCNTPNPDDIINCSGASSTVGYGVIKLTANSTYKDTAEDVQVQSLVYVIVNCEWELYKNLYSDI